MTGITKERRAELRQFILQAGYSGSAHEDWDAASLGIATELLDALDAAEAERDRLRQALKSAVHYMRNCGLNLERDFPEICESLKEIGND